MGSGTNQRAAGVPDRRAPSTGPKGDPANIWSDTARCTSSTMRGRPSLSWCSSPSIRHTPQQLSCERLRCRPQPSINSHLPAMLPSFGMQHARHCDLDIPRWLCVSVDKTMLTAGARDSFIGSLSYRYELCGAGRAEARAHIPGLLNRLCPDSPPLRACPVRQRPPLRYYVRSSNVLLSTMMSRSNGLQMA